MRGLVLFPPVVFYFPGRFSADSPFLGGIYMKSRTFSLKGDILWSRTPDTLAVCPGHYVVCEDGRCAGVFPALPERFSGIPVYDYSDRLIIPGLVDLHAHAPQYAFRALGMDLVE